MRWMCIQEKEGRKGMEREGERGREREREREGEREGGGWEVGH